MTTTSVHDDFGAFGADVAPQKMPAHWLMARLGKRVLRPGGIETTEWLLERLRIAPTDDVVELAPGLGVTARKILALRPASYTGVERDTHAADFAWDALEAAGEAAAFGHARILCGDAARVPLQDGVASVVVGEAMLSMQPMGKKRAIVAEAHRLLRTGGRYAIHELAVAPDDIEPERLEEMQRALSRSIHVGVRIGTVAQWKMWLEEAGFVVEDRRTTPMRLLELDGLVRDEGALGTARFVVRALRTPGAMARLAAVRAVFRAYSKELRGVAIVARKIR